MNIGSPSATSAIGQEAVDCWTLKRQQTADQLRPITSQTPDGRVCDGAGVREDRIKHHPQATSRSPNLTRV
eukprot:1632117-Alexandrium_andersonii.AAC.1